MRRVLFLIVLSLTIATSIWGYHWFSSPAETAIVRDVQSGEVSPTPVSQNLKVDDQQIWQHLQNLSYPRVTAGDRTKARQYLSQQLKQYGFTPQQQNFPTGTNLVATRPGTNPQGKTLIVGAHYDTVEDSPGADDNASGVAVVLEVARLFAKIPTPQTLQVVFFDQEEEGLLGSRAFVDHWPNLAQIQGAIILDMVGYGCYQAGCQQYPEGLPIDSPNNKGDFIAVIGDTEHPELLESFSQQEDTFPNIFPDIFTIPIPLKGLLTPDILRSDHAPFWKREIGAVLLTDTANFRSSHYHQPSDTPENIDRRFFKGSAQIVVNATNSLLFINEANKPLISSIPMHK